MKEERLIATDTTEIQKILDHYAQLYANKWDKLEEMDKFLQTYNVLRQFWRNRKLEQTNKRKGDWISHQKSADKSPGPVLIFKVYEELIQLNSPTPQIKESDFKMDKGPE